MVTRIPVLLVDDNSCLVDAYRLLLADLGFRVISASSGDEAVKLCACDANAAALAIVDLKMPGLDGPATIAALKTLTPQLKVISVSGQMLSPFFGRLADLGVRHFLSKPIGVDDLLETI